MTKNNKSKLLFGSNPLIIIPELAVLIGLNESIILQQIHYWLQKSSHVHDGRVWVYNSIPQWCEQFPFLSKPTLERAIASLRNKRLIFRTDKYNRLKQDRTLWYTINYDALEALQEKSANPYGDASHQNDVMPPSKDEKPANLHKITSHQNDVMSPSKRCDVSHQNDVMSPSKRCDASHQNDVMSPSKRCDASHQNDGLGEPLKTRHVIGLNPLAPLPEITTENFTETPENTHTDFRDNITPIHTEQIQKSKKPVCESPAATNELKELQERIKETIGEEIGFGRLKRLVQNTGIELVYYHLQHWHTHKLHVTKSVAGYFLTVVENDIPPQALPKQQYHTGKIPQRDNFDQREYTDEELEMVYADLSQETV